MLNFLREKEREAGVDARLTELELYRAKCQERHDTHEKHRRANDNAIQAILESQKITGNDVKEIFDIIKLYLPHLKTIAEIDATGRILQKVFAYVAGVIITGAALVSLIMPYL